MVYAVVGFCVLLAADLLAYVLPYPTWLKPLLLQTLLLGFPLTAVAVWLFDLRRDIRPVGGRDLDELRQEEELRRKSVLKTTSIIAASLVLTFTVSAFNTAHKDAPVLNNGRVVIAPLENRTGNASFDAIGNAAADWSAQRLIELRSIEIVPYSSVAEYTAAAPLSPAANAYSRALELARGVGAGLVVWGAYYVQGDSLRFSAQITDARTGELVRNVPATAIGLRDSLANSLSAFRENVAIAVTRQMKRPLSGWPAALSHAPAIDAHALFSQGLRLYAHGDVSGAARAFGEAARADTTFLVARIWQARSLVDAGDHFTADTITQHVNDNRSRLTVFDRTQLDHVAARATYNLDLSYGSSAVLVIAAPAADEAFHYLAIDALALNHPREARTALDSINPDHGATRAWPGYYENLAMAQHLVDNFRAESRIALEGRRRFPQDAELNAAACRAYAALNDETAAMNAIRGVNSGAAIVRCAEELLAHNHRAAAATVANSAVRFYNSRRSSVTDRLEHPTALIILGERNRAYDVMAKIAQEEVPAELAAIVQFRLAQFAALAGQNDRAVAHEVSAFEKLVDTPYGTLERARLAAARGNRMEALRMFGEALSNGLPYAEAGRVLPHADVAFRRLWPTPEFKRVLVPRG